MDFLGPINPAGENGERYVLLVVCYFNLRRTSQNSRYILQDENLINSNDNSERIDSNC
jgi:hypothetical protein